MRHLSTQSKSMLVSLLALHGVLVTGIHINCNGSGIWLAFIQTTGMRHLSTQSEFALLVRKVLPILGCTQIHQQQQL